VTVRSLQVSVTVLVVGGAQRPARYRGLERLVGSWSGRRSKPYQSSHFNAIQEPTELARCRPMEQQQHGTAFRRTRSRGALAPAAFGLLLLSATHVAPSLAAALPAICDDCEILLGIGGTYHFVGGTDGLVLPVTMLWDEGRYEAGVFRMATKQSYFDRSTHARAISASPYWGASVSRRWTVVQRPAWRLFFGFGASYKTQEDELSASRWNFASSLGTHVKLPVRSMALDLSLRHWSNAGLKLPNRGQDFATLSITWTLGPASWFAKN